MAEKKPMPMDNNKKKWIAIASTVATLGGVIVAVNAFTGLNFRPAWGFEVDRLVAANTVLERKLDEALDTSTRSQSAIVTLTRGQLDLKVQQIAADQRGLRRELASLQVQAQQFRDRNEPVPRWLTEAIADTEHELSGLTEDKAQARERLIRLSE